MEKICKNCKFWETDSDDVLENTNIKKCTRVKMFWDSTEWRETDDDYIRALTEESKNEKAFVQDASDYIAKLLTREDFGCNQFSE